MNTDTVDDILQKYQKELTDDLKIDEMNLKDKAMLVPILKHKWVSRQMTHKAQLGKLKALKKRYMANMVTNSPVAMNKKTLESASVTDDKLTSIQDNIDKVEITIEYLEKIEKLMSSLTWDCKNLIDLQKLETT